ncbi:hypothetical protein D3C72_2414740 [compost metagenome]
MEAKAIQNSEVAKSVSDIFRIRVLPYWSEAFPAIKRINKEVRVNTIKNKPLLLVPRCALQSEITVRIAP